MKQQKATKQLEQYETTTSNKIFDMRFNTTNWICNIKHLKQLGMRFKTTNGSATT